MHHTMLLFSHSDDGWRTVNGRVQQGESWCFGSGGILQGMDGLLVALFRRWWAADRDCGGCLWPSRCRWGQAGMKALRTIVALATVAFTMHLHGAWTHDSSYDDFEAATLVTASVSTMGEPYRTASFTFRCTDGGTDSPRLDAYFTFCYLNRAGDDEAPLRVKFGDDPPHDWDVRGLSEGQRGLIMVNPRPQVEKLADASAFKVRLAYHDEVGPTTISFSMEGARDAVGQVLASDCAAAAAAAFDRRREAARAYMGANNACFSEWGDSSRWEVCMRNKGVDPLQP